MEGFVSIQGGYKGCFNRALQGLCGLRGYRNLIKNPWAFIRVLYMHPADLGFQGQGVLIRFSIHYTGNKWLR